MIYDVIIVGAGAAGLFAGIQLDKKYRKIILEKTQRPGMKVLLSGGERANVSNNDIDPLRDYFTQNKKFLHSIFSKYNQWDIMGFFAENNVSIVEEDRSRLILESGDSQELLACLLKKVAENNCEIKTNQDIIDISFGDGVYSVISANNQKYQAKHVILSSGGKSFMHVGTTGEGYNIAKKLGINLVTPYRTLCGMSTKRDLSEVSGVSCDVSMQLIDARNEKKQLYSETGPLLFTHFGVSGPIIHNVSNAIGEYLNSLGIDENDFESYILENLSLEIGFDLTKTAKRLVKFFELDEENKSIRLGLQNWRSWREAKATGGGIDTNELDNHMQVKKYPGLYMIGEVIDVTGKTGGFNLQWAWSSAYCAAEDINSKLL